ncbi:MAG: AI-2E family transporter [Candidatus Aminicenantes bacterium]|nr:MAG: AI-2E family transporter [Candidatus Aminicenantes bacterium]
MQGNKVVTASLLIIVIFIGGVVLRLAKPVLFPFCLAVFLSFVFAPLEDYLTRLRIPRAVSIIFILILTFFILYLLASLIYTTGKAFAAELPKYSQKVSSVLTSIQERYNISGAEWQPFDWANQFDLSKVGGFLLEALGPFFAFVSNLFLVLLFMIFILAGRGQIVPKINHAFTKERASKVCGVIQNIDSQIQRYLAIKTVVSFFTGVFALIVLILFGVDFAILFGLLTFILNYIPNIGSFIATAFPVFIAIFQFETIWPAIWILGILVLIQQIMGTIVEPRLIGEGLDISPLVILFFLFFWGWLWGIPGMILAVPIAAIVKIVTSNIPELEFIAVFMSKGKEPKLS